MIKIKVAEKMGKFKFNNKKLAEITKIRPNTISAFYHENIKRIELWQLEALCRAFDNCPLHEIIEFIPDEKDEFKK